MLYRDGSLQEKAKTDGQRMTTFDRREEAFEARFAHDENIDFRAHARRNLKLGLWAAGHLGKSGDEAHEYAQALVTAEIEGTGQDSVFRKLQHDLRMAAVPQSDHQIKRQMDDLLAESRQEIRGR